MDEVRTLAPSVPVGRDIRQEHTGWTDPWTASRLTSDFLERTTGLEPATLTLAR